MNDVWTQKFDVLGMNGRAAKIVYSRVPDEDTGELVDCLRIEYPKKAEGAKS